MLSIESPCHPPTGALHQLGRPLFQLGQRHAQLQDLLAIALVICLYHETPLHGRLHNLEGSSASHSPIKHATYWSSRITASDVISRAVCADARLPPDESATPFSRQDKPPHMH